MIPAKLSKRISPMYRVIMGIVIMMVTLIIFAAPPPDCSLRVMKTGLGNGTISSPTGIACGIDCDETILIGSSVTFTAAPAPGSVFVRWEGDVTGTTNPVTVTLSADASVRAVFDLMTTIPALTDFTPEGIQTYLDDNPEVNTPARFVKALPVEYKLNWILMTRSESLQTGTAEFPRVLLPSADATSVFTIGMVEHESYPGSAPKAVEYMQWDATQKNFRFHEIILADIDPKGAVPARTRMVSADDSKCARCHSTNNVINRSAFPGTTGITPGTVPFKNKPNWDPNDSWGGMLAFNRDRIYQGTVEAAAFRKLFNPWTWRANDSVRQIMEQLELQPAGLPIASPDIITRTVGGANDGQINFAFDSPPVLTEPAPTGIGPGITTNYTFNNMAVGAPTPVVRDGPSVSLRHSGELAATGINIEGCGVQFFKLLSSLNKERVTDELIGHRYATGSAPVDIRPVALAISKGYIALNPARTAIISTTPLTIDLGFFNARNGSTTINAVYNDTKTRMESLPRRKADIQKLNLDRTGDNYLSVLELVPTNGLIQQYGAATTQGTTVGLDRIRQDVFRRPIDLGAGDATVVMGGNYVDRENYAAAEKLALFRYFLEPLGISVDKWSLGVRGRSRTYTFSEVFNTYINAFDTELKSSLDNPADPRYRPIAGLTDAFNEPQLIAAVNNTLSPAVLPAAADIPTYTDVQRIFNRSCIECHGGLRYPPYDNFGFVLDLSEDENPVAGAGTPGASPRFARSHQRASTETSLFDKITRTSEACPSGLMPCGGPSLSQTDIETIRRWIDGGYPYTNGDPHIRTVDGVRYDFQATGEFVLLRGENLEIQARHTAVETNGPITNAYTGITSCVSLNTAFAMQVGSHRISYQPNINGKPDPSGLQLRVNGKLVQISPGGISLATDGRIMPTSAPGGIQIEAAGGDVIVITPGWWEHYQLWFLNIDARHIRATMGLMGKIAPGNWLPALPNGTLLGIRPTDPNQRYNDLYNVFGNAWRVNDSISLFDYAPGTSGRSFITAGWPGGPSAQSCKLPGQNGDQQPPRPMTRAAAEQLAAGVLDADRRANLIEDLVATGDSVFAKVYLAADKINRNRPPERPALLFPKDFDTLKAADVRFEWNRTTDKDGDPLTYKLYAWPVNEIPDMNKAVAVSPLKAGWWSGGLKCALITALTGLLLFIILYFIGLRKKRGLLMLLALIILAAVIIAYFFCGKAAGAGFKATSAGLQPGKAYFWKVIVEDGRGGTTVSDTWRVQVK